MKMIRAWTGTGTSGCVNLMQMSSSGSSEKLCLAAALGMADLFVEDLVRFPYIPPTKVYGGYFDHSTKTFGGNEDNFPCLRFVQIAVRLNI